MAASAGAVRAGNAFVELGTNNTALERGLTSAEKRLRDFAGRTAKASLALTSAGGGLLAPVAKSFKDAFTRAADTQNLSDRFGVATEKISAMVYAFERGGSSLDGFAGTMESFQGKMFAAADGADDTFRRLGLNARAMVASGTPLNEQFDLVLERVNRLANPMDRATVGAELFGSEWSKLSNTVLKSNTAFNGLQTEAFNRGLVVTAEEGKRAQKFLLELYDAATSLQYAFMEIGRALIPQLDSVGSFGEAIKKAADQARDWIKDNRELILVIVKVGAVLLAAGLAMAALSSVAGGLSIVLGGVVVVVKLLIGALALLFSTGGLVLVGVVAVAALAGAFDGLGEVFGETWSGITAAISSGDIGLALKIAGAGAEAAWATFVANLTEIWVKFKDVVVDTWHDAVDNFAAGISVIKAGVTWVTDGGDKARAQLEGEINAIKDMRAAKDAENRKFRDDQIDRARAREAEARAELAALTNRAHAGKGRETAPGEEKPSDTSTSIGPDGKPKNGHWPQIDPQQLYTAAKGSFASIGGGNLGQSLGYGDNIGQRVLETNKKQLGVLGAIRDAIMKKPGIVWN